jgi:hypothetical protein
MTLDADGYPVDRLNDRGDVGVHGFWCRGHTAIFDIHITDMDAASYLSSSTSKILVTQKKAKKPKYLQPCLQRRRHFTPLVLINGINGKQCTILWHVDDLKISHVDKEVVEYILRMLNERYGKEVPLTVTRGKVHEYLGIVFD